LAAAWPTKVWMPSSARRFSVCRYDGLGSQDQIAEVAQDFGDAGHAGAAYANEMNVLDRVLHTASDISLASRDATR